MMTHPTLRFGVRLSRQKIEAAIDLKGIDIDDLGAELLSHSDGERRFAYRSRADDEKGIVHADICRA